MATPATATVPRTLAAVAGVVAAAVALAAGEFVAALAAPRPGPVTAVANRVVDHAPTWFVEFGKSVFGLADKPALVAGTVVLSLVLGSVFGLAARRTVGRGVLGIAAFGVIGFLALGVDARSGWLAAFVIAVAAAAAGITALLFLFAVAGAERSDQTVPDQSVPDQTVPDQTVAGDDSAAGGRAKDRIVPVPRRAFLGWAGTATLVAAAGGVAARSLRGRSAAAEARAAVTLPLSGDARSTAAEIERLVAAADAHPVATVEGISSFITPNDDFYLIDTAVLVPQVDPAGWQLTITGLVDRQLSYTYDELLARATTIAPVTLSCVSNQIGGDLVGTAVWQGVPLAELLDEAGIQPHASQIRSASVDGWDCGFPTELAYDGRTALVAIAMNGEPLPLAHGFPARLVVAGLYGYVSATKWLSEIELTTLEDFDGYWIPRGWSKDGPVKTQSRIDTPRRSSTLTAGAVVPIAGVAWAPDRGITTVEVQIDDDPWQPAELGASLGANAWRQWHLAWTATEGTHRIRVRATDGTGETQTEERSRPDPDGASGWHTIEIQV